MSRIGWCMVLALAGGTLCGASGVWARGITLHGRIIDAATGEPLPLASVQVMAQFTGTIANDEGFYTLEVGHLPVTLRVSYIGYASREHVVTDSAQAAAGVDFRLPVTPYTLPEMIVRPDEANRIMAEVIRRKAEWRPRVQSWRSEAHTRMTVKKDEEIVAVAEVVSEVHWQREGGYREVVVSQRHTDNMDDPDMDFGTLSAAEEFVDLYDDDIDFIENNLMGPTHPDALDVYDFDLIGRRLVDDRVVFDIDVRPKHKPEAAFVGRVSIVDVDFALIEAELTPSKSIISAALPLPLFEDFAWSFAQQWRQFDGLWLAVDYRFEGRVRIGTFGLHFPEIGVRGVTRMSNYEVNIDLPDSLYEEETIVRVDSTRVQADTAFARGASGVPLTEEEVAAYASLDSSRYLDKEFRPTGLWARFLPTEEEMDEEREKRRQERRERAEQTAADSGSARSDSTRSKSKPKPKHRNWLPEYSGAVRANRVEEVYAGGSAQYRLGQRTRAYGRVGYSTGVERVAGSAGLAGGRPVHGKGRDRMDLGFRVEYERGVARRYDSDLYHHFFNSAQALTGLDDYFDYGWREMVEVELSLSGWRENGFLWLTARDERQQTLSALADFGLLPFDDVRPNVPVFDGDIRSARLGGRLGHDYTPFGVTANRRLTLEAEVATDWFGSDVSFSTWRFTWDWQQPTFWTRRWLPNTLDLRVLAGASTGDVPPQRHAALDVAMGPFTPFGAFRTVHGHPYEGPRYAALFWEHNFRTVPFEDLGAWGLVRRGMGLVVHGASGRTWHDGTSSALRSTMRSTGGWHHELGASLILYGLFRVDVTRRLDQAGWRIGGSLARFDFD